MNRALPFLQGLKSYLHAVVKIIKDGLKAHQSLRAGFPFYVTPLRNYFRIRSLPISHYSIRVSVQILKGSWLYIN